MDGIAGVQARIAEIVGRFNPAPSAPIGAEGDFAAALTRAQATAAAAPAPPGGSGTLNEAGVDPVQWANDLLDRLGMPKTAENVRALVAWQRAEGTRARYNPLATIQSMPGATKLNSVGVKNYATYEDGLTASVKAITNGRYPNILAALRRGDSAVAVGEAVAASPWGTGQLMLRILRSE